MRILYLHQHFSTPAGATGTRSYEFARRLVARGHKVTMVCGSYVAGRTGLTTAFIGGVRRGYVDEIDVVEFELPYSNADSFVARTRTFLLFARRTLRMALSPGYDLILATSTPLTVAIPGIVAKLLRGRAFIIEVRDLWPELPRAMGVISNPIVLWALDILERVAYRTADGCVGLAPGIVEGILRKVPGKRIEMIPNGCDLDMHGPADALPSNVEQLLGRTAGSLRCLFAGAHGIANGLDAVLDAASVLRDRGANIVFLLVGSGGQKISLEERARRDGLDNCHFLEPLPKRTLALLQTRVDVGLMILRNISAFYDGTSPNKFFDYIASGLPVLINYPGWLARVIAEEQCGIAVPPDDPQAMASALETLNRSPDARRSMGRSARALAERSFSRDQLGQQFVRFIESVAHAKRIA